MVTDTIPTPGRLSFPHLSTFFLLVFFDTVPAAAAAAAACVPPPPASNFSCPPFPTAAVARDFPFAPLSGCGRPSSPVTCCSPNSLFSVNNLSFAVLQYGPKSLKLTPQTATATAPETETNSCPHFPSIPSQPFNFSNSPFRISDDLCPRLSALRSCSNSSLRRDDCGGCAWQCDLIGRPALLVPGCGSGSRPPVSEQGCQQDVLGYLDRLLRSGICVEWENRDAYLSDCSFCKSRNGVCRFNSSEPEKGCGSLRPKSSQLARRRLAVLSSVLAVTSVAFVVAVVTVVFRWKRLRSLAGGGEEDPTIVFLHRHRPASLLPPLFTYEELQSSTNRFDPKRKIGDGGFGSVYLGRLEDGRVVAVKHLHRHHSTAAARRAFTTRAFCNEILILSAIDHPNLVKLHGYCSDPRGLLLVYDYVPNGTLADHLHGAPNSGAKGPLTWPVRVDVALQTAMAIEYLHFSVAPAIVHRDITSSNIFVGRDMGIKLGDFGLSRLLVFPETTSSSATQCVWTGPQGTPGYLDPDYHRSFRLTEKSDVYSFGVVMLELITGKKAVDERREWREATLADLAVPKIQMGLLRQVVDPALAEETGGDGGCGVGAMAELAFRCVAADKEDRPDAREAVAVLERIRSLVGGGGGGGGAAPVSGANGIRGTKP